MTQINYKDPLELLFDEDIYFPFKVPDTASASPLVKTTLENEKTSESLRMASVFMTTPEGKLLDTYEKILMALGRKRSETPELISVTPSMEAIVSFLREHACNGVVVWGVKPEELGVQAKLYELTPLHQVHFLFSDSLIHLENDESKKLKRILWTELRSHFNKN